MHRTNKLISFSFQQGVVMLAFLVVITGLALAQSTATLQPSIDTVAECKADNFTFPAEYGRNSGAIVNIAARSGAIVKRLEIQQSAARAASRTLCLPSRAPSPDTETVFGLCASLRSMRRC